MPDEKTNRIPVEVRLSLIAVGIGILEGLLPKPVPFMKFGLANIITIIAVVRYGLLTALKVNLLRVIAVSLLLGTLLTPTFLLSLAGGITSAVVMGGVKKFFSVPAVSVSGSLASLYIQLSLVLVLFPDVPLRGLLLVVTVWGVLSGLFTGSMALLFLKHNILHRCDIA